MTFNNTYQHAPPPPQGLPAPTNQGWYNNFLQAGVDDTSSIRLNCNVLPSRPIPTQYALAAAALIHTVNINMDAINKSAILDSGTTSNFLTPGTPVTKVQLANKPIIAGLPNRDQVQSMHMCRLDLPKLPAMACCAHIIPGLALHTIVSVVTLCNAGCEVLFTKIGCTNTHRGCTILCGSKCMHTGL